MRAPRRSLFAMALFAAACVPAAIAAAELSSDTPHQHGLFHSLSREQKIMMFVDMRKETTGMSDEQRKAYRQSQRQRFAAMTDVERQQFAAKLQSEWDSLPADQKESVKQQVMTWRAQRWNHGGGDGQGAQ